MLRVDAVEGTLAILTEGALERAPAQVDLTANQSGTGREMFEVFRSAVGPAEAGASVFGV
jgi:phosphogluconate dehydratase